MRYKENENTIMDDLIIDIKEGRYKENDKLPSASTLSALYGVTRIEVRKVYEKLEAMGYVYAYQGRGYYLRPKADVIELVLSGKESFTKKMIKLGKKIETINIECERIAYNKKIYNELYGKENEEIYKISRLRVVNNEPIAIHVSYIRKNLFPNIYVDGKKIKSIFDYYNKHEFRNLDSTKRLITVEFPTKKEREIFKCGELVPMIKLESNCIDKKSGITLEYSETYYRGDRFKYRL